jgi:hypothetical protein
VLKQAENQHEGYRGSGPQSEVEMERPRGKNGPAQTGTGYISVGRKAGQQENWATADPMGRHVQESSRRTLATNSQKQERME